MPVFKIGIPKWEIIPNMATLSVFSVFPQTLDFVSHTDFNLLEVCGFTSMISIHQWQKIQNYVYSTHYTVHNKSKIYRNLSILDMITWHDIDNCGELNSWLQKCWELTKTSFVALDQSTRSYYTRPGGETFFLKGQI